MTILLHYLRGATGLSDRERAELNESKKGFELIKLAAVVATIALIFLVCLEPTAYGVTLVCICGLLAREIIQISNNLLETLTNPELDLRFRRDPSAFIDQCCKDTWIAGAILRSF